jgi:hypothetical protein
VHLGLLLALTLVFRVVRWKSDQWVTAGESGSSATKVFHSPFAAALLLTLFDANRIARRRELWDLPQKGN